MTNEDVDDIFYLSEGYVQEATEAQNYRWKKKAERDEAWKKQRETKNPEDRERYVELDQEYK